MKGYERYIEGVKSGEIVACEYIKLAVERFERFRARDDVYFDSEAVDNAFNFIGHMRHWLGKSANKPFELLDWQQFFLACILGLKWKKNGYRVCRETYLSCARKQGKSSIIAAIALYFLIVDGEAAPSIACLASTRDQASLIFNMIQSYGRSIDTNGTALRMLRNQIKCDLNHGEVKVYSADASKLDGLNLNLGIVDEFAVQPNLNLYQKLKTSMGMREQPLMVLITTPQGNLSSPAYDIHKQSIEILEGIKEDDTFWPFLYTLDPEDEPNWDNPDVWQKSNPALGVTVTKEFLESEVLAAKNDPRKLTNVKCLDLGIWCQSETVWIENEVVARCMKERINLEDYKYQSCMMGMDLSSVGDFSSISIVIPDGDKRVFKSWCFLPQATLDKHPNRELYKKFIQEGTMIITPGNCIDYSFIINKIHEIAQVVTLQTIWADSWNATQIMVELGDLGYDVRPYSQSIGHYNSCTKSMERLVRDGNAVIDKSSCVLWQFMNVSLKTDHNGNVKPSKENYERKIDSVISMCTALGGLEENPITSDWEIIGIKL